MQTRSSAVLLLALLASACARPAAPSATDAQHATRSGTQQIVASMFSEPAGLHQEVTNPTPSAGSVPGLDELYTLVDGGGSYLDSDNVRQPWLMDALPTIDNALWKVFPDGTMQTTWRLKSGVAWHDGAAVTSDDLRFTLDVYRDPEIGAVAISALKLIDSVEVADAQTMVLTWSRPYIDADGLFGSAAASSGAARVPPIFVLPQHILDDSFQNDKAGFFSLPYWRESFVGAGPYKIIEWAEGNHVMLAANDNYILGRPHIDRIEVRFFTDRGALKAGLLAGAVQVHLGRGLNVDDVTQIRDKTQEVKVQLGGTLAGVLPIYPQFIDPDPPIVANVQFRRALLQAIDRQELTDTLNNGLGPVANSWVQPDQPEGRAIDNRLVKYSYDPRAAAQMIEALGYAKGPDGMYQSADGVPLSVGLMTHEQNSFHVPASLSVQTAWQQLGLDVQLNVLPAARAFDLKTRATFPSFILLSKGVLAAPDGYFTRHAIPLPDNNYAGGNAARYGSAELDGLIDKYGRTIPFGDRMAVLGDIVHFQTDQLTMLPLFFQGAAFVIGSTRMKNVLAGQVSNAHQWEVD
ncbi:MAG TPA: ABC transporter substrate-binding protein [Chloroflexota bacterium]|nr:ABC transporter substrate-binding protein [Chloroflexota bacterium]